VRRDGQAPDHRRARGGCPGCGGGRGRLVRAARAADGRRRGACGRQPRRRRPVFGFADLPQPARRAAAAGGQPDGGLGELLGGHISFRLAGGVSHAEEVPHLVKPGWQHLMTVAELPEAKPVRQMLGEVPVAAIRINGVARVLADRCSHMSGPLSDGELADGCLTCP